MFELYIKYENQKILGHPVLRTNLQEIYPDTDFELSYPEGWVPFIREPAPMVDRTKQLTVFNGYKLVDGIATDDWIIEFLPDNYYPQNNDVDQSTPDDA